MRDTTNDDLIYLLIRTMKDRDAIAIGTLPRGGEIKLEIGHVVQPISKVEYDSYIVLDLFSPYEPKDPQYVWVDIAGPTGLYFGMEMYEEDKRHANTSR